MYHMTNVDKFNPTLKNYEALDLSFKLFENLDYQKENDIVSFYRCDFRGSHFENCVFSKNPFGRADFIDVYVYGSKFIEVNWGSCLFENAMFDNVVFLKNQYRGVAARYSHFKNCTFQNESIITNMFDCTFEDCTFIDCLYEKSTISNVSYINCTFIRTDISQCHAEKLKFDTCHLEEVYLGLTFWGTYLFKNTYIKSFAFRNRGKIIDIVREEYFYEAFTDFWKKGRLYEFLNAHIISKQLCMKSDLLEITQLIFEELNNYPVKIRRKNIINILDLLEFYLGYENIDFITYNAIIEYISIISWKTYSFDEAIEYSSKIFKIQNLMSNFAYDYKYLYTINSNQTCECKIRINCDNSENAIEYISSIFDAVNSQFCKNYYKPPFFEIEKIEFGSIILTISSWLLLVVFATYCTKKIVHNIESIKIEHAFSLALQKKISETENSNSISDIDKIGKIITKYRLVDTTDDYDKFNIVSNEITKGEIISIIINLISSKFQ